MKTWCSTGRNQGLGATLLGRFLSYEEELMKKLRIAAVGAGAGVTGWLVWASVPSIKRYIRMHQM